MKEDRLRQIKTSSKDPMCNNEDSSSRECNHAYLNSIILLQFESSSHTQTIFSFLFSFIFIATP